MEDSINYYRRDRRDGKAYKIKLVSKREFKEICVGHAPVMQTVPAMYGVYSDGNLVETITEDEMTEKYYTDFK